MMRTTSRTSGTGRPRKPARARTRGAVSAGLGAGLSICLLAGCAPAPEPEVLTVSTAGAAYLSAVCPVNSAWDDADIEIDRLRLALGRGEAAADIDTAPFAESMRAVAQADKRAVDFLGSETRTWPSSAEAPIDAVRASLQHERKQALRVAKLDADEAANYAWQGVDESAEAAVGARKALQLPDDPQAACTEWEKQRLEQQRAQRSHETKSDQSQQSDEDGKDADGE